MNLKEAFRFQNKLQALMDKTQELLSREANVMRVERTIFHKKVMPDMENETILEDPGMPYAEQITELSRFLMYLMNEHERLSKAVRRAKDALSIDMDSEISLNKRRQALVRVFGGMADLRSKEVIQQAGGHGFRFNQEGNQVGYRCDVKIVSTINFDRKVVRGFAVDLNRKADHMSAELDRCMVNSSVSYKPPFNVNDSFAEIFEAFAAGRGAA